MTASHRPRPAIMKLPADGAWLLAGTTAALAPYTLRDEPWLLGVWLLLALWFAYAVERSAAPQRRYLVPATLAGMTAVFIAHGNILGLGPGLSLLVIMTGLKLQEAHSVRDRLLVVYLGFFLIGGQLLLYDDLLTALYLAGAAIFLCAVWMRIGAARTGLGMAWAWRRSATLIGLAIPIAIVLFVLFPRGIGPFWGVPGAMGEDGVTGLSDRMDPGAIQNLAESDAIAFRAWFPDGFPEQRERYWRGPVLWASDGMAWERGPDRSEGVAVDTPSGQATQHTILLEPTHHRWLIALDRPVTAPAQATLALDGVLSSPEPLDSRQRYTLHSARDKSGANHLPGGLGLELPRQGNPRTRALAEELGRSTERDEAIVEAVVQFLQEHEFRYTLTPPAHGGPDAVDRFLFETRTGFCEHFAGSVAFLLRAAGLPTRVVLGYQGGQANPMGEYLIVRQSDAHAWLEVYLDEAWRRMDPTAIAAPERLEGDIAGPGNGAVAHSAAPLLHRVMLTWDVVNATWHHWILTYNETRQGDLLEQAGLDGLSRWHLLALGVLLTAVWLGLAGTFAFRRRRPADPVVADYERFRARLAAAGVAPRLGEGPWHYAARAIAMRPADEAYIRRITERYVALRYAGRDDPDLRRALRRAVRRFRPARS